MTTLAPDSCATPRPAIASRGGLRTVLAALCCIAVGVVAPAQDDDAQALGFCRSASGRPLADAEVWWLPREPTGIDWLDRRLPRPAPVRGTTDARGRFRFAVPPTPALCLVIGPEGLGAVVPDAAPDTPLQIVTQPLGELTRGDGLPIAGRIRLAAEHGATPFLPPVDGTAVALPAGDYLGWFGSPGVEVRFRLDSASRVTWPATATTTDPPPALPPPPPGHTWIAAGSARWPLTLPPSTVPPAPPALGSPAGPDRLEAWLRGPQGDRLWTAAWPPQSVDREAAPGTGRWLDCRIAADAGPATAGAWALSVALADSGQVRVLAADRVAADGTCHALLADPADPSLPAATHLVLWAPDAAPAVHRLDPDPDREPGPRILPRLGAAQTARVRVLAADGSPLAGARVEVDPAGDAGVLRRVRVSDARGLARLHGLPVGSAATIQVRHPTHLPFTVVRPADAAADTETTVQLAAGLTVVGRVFAPDGHPAVGVGVELRETTATSGAAPRRVATGDDGSFRFDGLPEGLFTLFTSRQTGATTWSAIRRGVQSGTGDEWRLDLRSEDPPPPGRRRDD